MHPWPVFTPEANYEWITSGAGPAPTVAHAEGYATLAAQLESVGAVSMVNAAGTYGTNWTGFGSIAAAAAHTEVNGYTSALAAVSAARVAPLMAAAEAHPATVAMMVTAEHAVANRMEEAADQQINPWVLGGLTPRIADLNLEYFGYMWPNNASRGAAYGAVLRASAAAILTPSVPAISGASPAAAAAATAAVAETAALSGAGAAMQAAEQGATALVSPAVAAPSAALGAVPLAAPAAASAPAAQPLAAVQLRAPTVPAQPMAPAQAPVGMFAPGPQAATLVAPPAAPDPAPPDSPVAQTMTPRPAPGVGPVTGPVPGPTGVTSFIRPARPFAASPPTAGRATGLRPGMLNATALRGPVTTMPLTTAPSPAAVQPPAYVPPSHRGPPSHPPRHNSRCWKQATPPTP